MNIINDIFNSSYEILIPTCTLATNSFSKYKFNFFNESLLINKKKNINKLTNKKNNTNKNKNTKNPQIIACKISNENSSKIVCFKYFQITPSYGCLAYLFTKDIKQIRNKPILLSVYYNNTNNSQNEQVIIEGNYSDMQKIFSLNWTDNFGLLNSYLSNSIQMIFTRPIGGLINSNEKSTLKMVCKCWNFSLCESQKILEPEEIQEFQDIVIHIS